MTARQDSDAVGEATAGDAVLLEALLTVRNILAGIEGHQNGDDDDRLAALIAMKFIDVTIAAATGAGK